MRQLVYARGHSVVEHSTLEPYAATWLEQPLDVAFVDLSTDGECGLAAVGLTRLRMPSIRITVIDGGKGNRSLDRLASAVSLGAEEFMKKPIVERDATDVLERLGL